MSVAGAALDVTTPVGIPHEVVLNNGPAAKRGCSKLSGAKRLPLINHLVKRAKISLKISAAT